ncbi:MAG: YwiC-like family protein [Nitrospinae bacterium]|nr:YwiC-like family protein [Nitrospinota bacterium]
MPKEHGIWVLILAPLLAGSLSVHADDGFKLMAALLLSAAVVSGMMIVEPFKMVFAPLSAQARDRGLAWLVIYSICAVIFFSPLLILYGRWGLFIFAAAGAALGGLKMWAGASRIQRELWVELTGVAGLTLTAPAASYTQTGQITPASVIVYLLCLIWFFDRVMTARKTLLGIRSGASFGSAAEKTAWFKKELMIHMACLGIAAVIVAASLGVAPWTAFPPFLLASAKFRLDMKNTSPPPGPMQVGYSEMRLSSAFTLLLSAAFYWG